MTTTHPNPGDLRAFLDGEARESDQREIHRHLQACTRCRRSVDALKENATEVRRVLSALDPPPRTAQARRRVEARLGVEEKESASRFARGSLARAALLVLALGAGASAAVPGSPVRGWLDAAWSAMAGGSAPAGEATDADSATARPAEVRAAESGVRVAPAEAGLRVELVGVPSGTGIRVRLVDRGTAGVFAPSGTRFESAEGSIRATISGDGGTGSGVPDLRVELPRGAERADVRVDGRTYLRLRGGRVELPGPEPQRVGADEYRFPSSGAPDAGNPEP